MWKPKTSPKGADLLFLLVVSVLPSSAQDANHRAISANSSTRQAAPYNPTYSIEKGTNEFGVWGGGSFHSSTIEGQIEDAKLGIVGLRYARVLTSGRGVALEYTVDAIPLAILSYPSFEVFQTGSECFEVKKTRRAVYAAGLSPIGFQLHFRSRHRVQPFVNSSGGFLYFASPFPDIRSVDIRGTQFNFAVDLGGGVQVLTRPRRALTFGYKYHHISNGGRGQINPGVDSNVFYMGISIFKTVDGRRHTRVLPVS